MSIEWRTEPGLDRTIQCLVSKGFQQKLMFMLVDYDNVPPIARERGIEDLTTQLLEVVCTSFGLVPEQCTLRLYGGWFEGETLTQMAQQLHADIDASFPSVKRIAAEGRTLVVRASVELAKSILAFPHKNLSHTYRPRGWSGLKCFDRPFKGCRREPDCKLSNVHSFVSARKCPEEGCNVHPKKVFFRAEQKLVDTMIACDISYLGSTGADFVVVTADDDLWPPILQLVSLGNKVHHISPRQGQAYPDEYVSGFSGKYFFASLYQ